MWYEDEPTPEQKNAEYLWQNPGIESELWAEWVCVVCGRDKIPYPSQEEWDQLKANFYHGKAPVDSVAELKKMRS